jgi:chromatin remodeling complex protein RSC6
MNHKKYYIMPAKKVVAEPVAAVPATVAKTVEDKKPVSATKKTTDKKVDTAPATTVAPVDVVVDSAKEETSGGELIISGLLEKVSTMSSQLKTIQTALKQLVKEFDKQKKIIDKVQKKREKAKKSPSGFAKPCKISDELCDFIGIPKGTEQSRTDITRYINSYVKQHNLNNPENRREFFPDKKLKSILNVKDGEKVTYFILQRLIAHHFPPSMSKLAAAAKTT